MAETNNFSVNLLISDDVEEQLSPTHAVNEFLEKRSPPP